MWYCYIKPNRHVHNSGYRCFEVGYCTVDGNLKVDKEIVLGTYSDCIHLYDLMGSYMNRGTFEVRMDLTKDGYIRLFNSENNFHWRQEIFSDAILEPGIVDQEWCEAKYKEMEKEFE